MRKALLFFVIITVIFALIACEKSTSVSVGLSADDTILAKQSGDQWDPVNNGKFKKGETVGLVMLNVKAFKKGNDGLNWIDMDVEVKDPDGKVILSEKDLLGDSGKLDLKDNIAKSPVGNFSTTSSLQSGKYTIKVTVYDKIGKGYTTNSKTFDLE